MSPAGRSGLLLQQDAVQDEACGEHDDQPHDGAPCAGRVQHPGQGSHASRGHEGAQAGGEGWEDLYSWMLGFVLLKFRILYVRIYLWTF